MSLTWAIWTNNDLGNIFGHFLHPIDTKATLQWLKILILGGMYLKCPECSSKISVNHSRCKECGKDLGDVDLQNLKQIADKKTRKIFLVSIIFLALIFGGVSFKVYFNNQANEEHDAEIHRVALEEVKHAREEAKLEQERIATELADFSWVPKSFTKFSLNSNVAYERISYEAADCYQDWCFGMMVVSRDYCTTLSISANLLRNDVLLDEDSDYRQSVYAGQKVVMKLGSSQQWDSTLWTEVKCT